MARVAQGNLWHLTLLALSTTIPHGVVIPVYSSDLEITVAKKWQITATLYMFLKKKNQIITQNWRTCHRNDAHFVALQVPWASRRQPGQSLWTCERPTSQLSGGVQVTQWAHCAAPAPGCVSSAGAAALVGTLTVCICIAEVRNNTRFPVLGCTEESQADRWPQVGSFL